MLLQAGHLALGSDSAGAAQWHVARSTPKASLLLEVPSILEVSSAYIAIQYNGVAYSLSFCLLLLSSLSHSASIGISYPNEVGVLVIAGRGPSILLVVPLAQ